MTRISIIYCLYCREGDCILRIERESICINVAPTFGARRGESESETSIIDREEERESVPRTREVPMIGRRSIRGIV